MKCSKLDSGIYGPPSTLPTSYAVPDGPTYCGGFADLPIELLNSYGFYEATEPTVPEGYYLSAYGSGELTGTVVSYPNAQIEKIPAPSQVTMRQARLQLLALGVYNQVNQAIASMGQAAEIEWEYAAVVDRSNALVAGMAQLLGWTTEDTDNYFTEAAKL